MYHFLIASGGVSFVTTPLQRLSTSTSLNDPSYSVGFTAKIEVIFSLSGVDSVASFHDI
jgi:hypothetical protein